MKKIILTSLLLVSIVGCSRNVVIKEANTSTLKDCAIKAGEISPIDGVVVTWGRYEHLLLSERKNDD